MNCILCTLFMANKFDLILIWFDIEVICLRNYSVPVSMQATTNQHSALRAVNRCLTAPTLSIQLLVFGRPDDGPKTYYVSRLSWSPRRPRDVPWKVYTRGLIIGRSPKIHPDISPNPPLNFTGGSQVRNLASILTHCGLKMEELIANLILPL